MLKALAKCLLSTERFLTLNTSVGSLFQCLTTLSISTKLMRTFISCYIVFGKKVSNCFSYSSLNLNYKLFSYSYFFWSRKHYFSNFEGLLLSKWKPCRSLLLLILFQMRLLGCYFFFTKWGSFLQNSVIKWFKAIAAQKSKYISSRAF